MQLNTEALKYLRMTRGFTQRSLSVQVGVSEISIGYYEQGRMQPSPKRLKKLADVLGVEVAEIITDSRKATA